MPKLCGMLGQYLGIYNGMEPMGPTPILKLPAVNLPWNQGL